MRMASLFKIPGLMIFVAVFTGLTSRAENVPAAEGLPFTLRWSPLQTIGTEGDAVTHFLAFDGAVSMEGFGTLPAWTLRIPEDSDGNLVVSASVSHCVFISLTASEMQAVHEPWMIPAEITPVAVTGGSRGTRFTDITLLPFRKNPETGNVEKLLSFDLVTQRAQVPVPDAPASATSWAANSVLSAGTWYKFSVTQDGIYRITYDDLKAHDINMADINPANIRLFSNGGGMLPEANSSPRTDDLREHAILVFDGNDGTFGPGDYILFYGESPDRWVYNSQNMLFSHIKNIYSDKTYYFLTFDQGPGKRMETDGGTGDTPTNYISKFNDRAFYEQDNLNLVKSGREWYDIAYFDVTTTREYQFSFPNIDHVTPVTVKAVVAARSTSASSSFDLLADNQQLAHISIQPVSPDFLETYARQQSGAGSFNTSNQVITVKLVYNRFVSSAVGYLNYLEVNAMRDLVFTGSQMNFRSGLSAGQGKVAEFTLTTQGQPVYVWDVTNTGDAQIIQTTSTGNSEVFRLKTNILREFIAFDGASYLSPEFTGRVENQNLHGVGEYDYVIVSNPAFMKQAEELADFHRQLNGFRVLVAPVDKIFNEFSSGAQDITAIRDFVRMMYERSGGTSPKYLLLFGDASYDYKDRVQGNMNLVPTYESVESLEPIYSYATDDYFVLLEPGEGAGTNGSLDMGIGRLPVQSAADADGVIAKIRHYSSMSDSVKNDWRNVLCFVADDEDGNLHLDQVESITNDIAAQHPVYNIDKIYLDAYQQISTPGGQRIPDVNEAINRRVKNGALVVNYTGHGGEVGWAHERVLEVADINAWTNMDNMPVFVTATCEFSRYDDPERVSAGELVFLNPKGGGIALFTTARPTFASTNFQLASAFYDIAFSKQDGHYLKMGDLIRLAKNNLPSSPNTRKFVLLGDPALMMAYPQLNVVTTSINGNSANGADTLQALSLIEISGEVQEPDGTPATGFNGEVFTTVFDKPALIQTFGDNSSKPVTFSLQKNQIYSGKVNVTEGQFSFSFIVPKDISYDYGNGKISYYARSPETDANGFDNTIVIGGFNPIAAIDDQGPEIALYMNDRKFINGSITDQNPVLLADLSDQSGINTVGNGIGHDITAVLDDDTQTPMILNDYYVADLNTYKSGVIAFPLNSLSEGRHHITLKVWDVYNNSSQAVISFVVTTSDQYHMVNLYNYPNPFRTSTTFSFESNQADTDVNVELSIFNMYGRIVKKFDKTLYISGYRSEPLTWDGTDESGSKCAAGMYVYRVKATLPDGTETSETAKLVLLR